MNMQPCREKPHSISRPQRLIPVIILALLLAGVLHCSSSGYNHIKQLDREIISVQQWGGIAYADSHQTHEIKAITLHHGGEEYKGDKATSSYLVNLQNWSRREKKWIDIPYHLLIDLEGKIYAGRDLHYPGDTNTAYDPTGHALVCILGNYEVQQPNDRQLRALVEVFTWLCWSYKLSPEVIQGHKDVAEGTVCPGKNLYVYLINSYLRNEVAHRLQHLSNE